MYMLPKTYIMIQVEYGFDKICFRKIIFPRKYDSKHILFNFMRTLRMLLDFRNNKYVLRIVQTDIKTKILFQTINV